jgi:diguanylate cyclase (GGDEF)-like protein/PAS domain S-box-containing protein
VLLLTFIRSRPGLRRVGLLFATFIVSCGLTHLSEIWTIWHPDYWVSGGLKLLTAIASLSTVAALLPLMPFGQILRRFSNLDRINRELESQYRLIVESSNDGIWLVDRAGRTTFANRRLCQMLGLTGGELADLTIDALMRAETGAAEAERIRRHDWTGSESAGANVDRFEVCFSRKDGSAVWTELHVAALRDADGRDIGAVLTVADVTQERRTRLALLESEREYRMLAEAMPHAVFTATADGTITYANRWWAQYVGSSDPPSLAAHWSATLHRDDVEGVRAGWSAAVERGETFEMEFRAQRASDGSYRWCVSRATPVFDAQGAIVKWIGSALDIHDYKVATETRDILDAMGHIVSIHNAEGRVDYVSPSFALVTGTPAVDGGGADWFALVHAEDRAGLVDWDGPSLASAPAVQQREIRIESRSGTFRWFLCRTVALPSLAQAVGRRITSLTDIDDLKRTQAALGQSEARYRALTESMPQMVWTGDSNECVHFVNTRWLAYTGLTFEPGMRSKTLAITHPDDTDMLLAARGELLAGGDIDCEVRLRRHDGVYRWHLMRTVPLASTEGSAQTWVVTATDIEDRKAAEMSLAQSAADLDHRAHHDLLTDLPNRIRLVARLDALIAQSQRDGTEIAVLYVDLDHFKTINDTLGHNAGDELLVEASRRIRSALRSNDIASRFGGDEFVIVCEVNSDDAASVATRVAATFATPASIGGKRVAIGASIGLSVFPADGTTAAELVHHADIAMYHAKTSGRNGWARYCASIATPALPAIDLEIELREAIAAEAFVVYYQPIFDTASAVPVGAEALVRWAHPTRGILTPDAFVAFAEAHGLIAPIGELVLSGACAQIGRLPLADTEPFTIAVNVSAHQFAKPGFSRSKLPKASSWRAIRR